MRTIEHFSTYQELPIKIDDIASLLVDVGYVNFVKFHPTDDDGEALAGMLYFTRYKPPYVSGDEITVAHISYNTQTSEHEQKLVVTKELLHIADSDLAAARTEEIVNRLVREIITPLEALKEIESLGKEAVSDHSGYLRAVALLFPIEARDTLKPLYDEGTLSAEEIESIVEIPIGYIRLVMSDEWSSIYDSLIENSKTFCK